MRIIITGGSGMIGRPLVRSLAADDHEVIVLSRSPALVKGLPSGVRVEGWDGRTAKGWGALADGADAIINLAGESIAGEGLLPQRWTEERKARILQSRVDAGKAVVEAVTAAARKPGVVVQSSAVGYYGTHGPEKTITEESPAGDDFLAKVCIAWEESTAPVEALGVRRPIARTGIVITFDGGALVPMALPFRFFAGGPIGSGKQPFPWIHIDDEVRALRFLVENPNANGPFNLAAPEPPTNAEFSRALGHIMGRPSLIPAPAFAFELAFGEVAMLVTEGQRTIPQRLLDLGFQFKFTDAEAALRDLYKSA